MSCEAAFGCGFLGEAMACPALAGRWVLWQGAWRGLGAAKRPWETDSLV